MMKLPLASLKPPSSLSSRCSFQCGFSDRSTVRLDVRAYCPYAPLGPIPAVANQPCRRNAAVSACVRRDGAGEEQT